MTDNRDSVPGSDGAGGGAPPPPFPDLGKAPPAAAAPPAPSPAPPPTPYPAAPARPAPWGWIVAAILAVALITLVCLYFFTSLLDKAPRDSWRDGGGSSFSQSGSGSGSGALGSSGGSSSGQGTYSPPPPPPTTTNPVAGYAPTAGWIQGTWGPGCPGSSAQAITFFDGGRLVAQGGEGSWTLDGYIVTLNGNGRTLVTRWEYLSQDAARVTQVANGQTETVRRCL